MKKLIFILTCFLTAFSTSGKELSDSIKESAISTLIRKADAADPKALYDLSLLYEDGYGSIYPDPQKADSLLSLSADAGYAAAQNYLGYKIIHGYRFPKSPSDGLKWIEKAAMQGEPKAYSNLGWLLLRGEGVEHDQKKAIYWLEKGAEAGLPVAMSLLAEQYTAGNGVDTDTLKARRLYENAMRGGLADAETRLINLNRPEIESISPDSAINRAKYYRSMGGMRLGAIYLLKAAQSENPEAMALLAHAYSRGEGVRYNHEKSIEYFYKSAKAGNPSARFVIGELLAMFPDALDDLPEGIIPTEEEKIADYWLSLAAEAGIDDAAKATAALLSQ